jgi:hypothetical protein
MTEKYETNDRTNNMDTAKENTEILRLKYTERADYFYRQFHDDSFDSDISGAIWTQKEAEARRMFDIYCEVLNDLNSIR